MRSPIDSYESHLDSGEFFLHVAPFKSRTKALSMMVRFFCIALLHLSLVGIMSCGNEDEGPKFPLVEDECSSQSDCPVQGELCESVCNEVGGYEVLPNVPCNYREGAVGEPTITKCVAIPECNDSHDPETTPLVFTGQSLTVQNSICYGAEEVDVFTPGLDGQSLIAYFISADTQRALFKISNYSNDGSSSSFNSGSFPTKYSGLVSGAGEIMIDTVNVPQPSFTSIVPVNYQIQMWVYSSCTLNEECEGECVDGFCSGCLTDEDCGADAPFCGRPKELIAPKLCLTAEELDPLSN